MLRPSVAQTSGDTLFARTTLCVSTHSSCKRSGNVSPNLHDSRGGQIKRRRPGSNYVSSRPRVMRGRFALMLCPLLDAAYVQVLSLRGGTRSAEGSDTGSMAERTRATHPCRSSPSQCARRSSAACRALIAPLQTGTSAQTHGYPMKFDPPVWGRSKRTAAAANATTAARSVSR